MKKQTLLLIAVLISCTALAQNVGIGTTTPDASAQLDVSATDKGMLIPRMTSAQRAAIASPAKGLLVFDNETSSFWFFDGAGWVELITGGGAADWHLNGNNLYNTNSGNVGIGTNNPQSKMHVAGNIKVDGTNTIEFGAGIAGKEENAGKIGYQTFSPDALDIVGAGAGGSANRKIKFWNEGGASFRGSVGIGTDLPDFRLNVSSNLVQANSNTNLLKLTGQNPIMVFSNGTTDFGYLKAWTYNPYAPFTSGMVIGSSPGYPISFSTNNFSLSMIIADNGNVGIGTANPTYKLSVNGNIHSKEVVVETGWADYVFDENYHLPKLGDVEKFIQKNNHLPNIPSAKEVEEKGLHLGDVQKRMMEKIEELTLYIIEANKKIEKLEQLIREKK